MKNSLLYTGLLSMILFVCSCISNLPDFPSCISSIHGGKIIVYQPHSRNLPCEVLPTGSQITFYSQGGICADEALLTYNGNTWEGNIDFSWNNEQKYMKTCAFYPPIYRKKQNLYQDGKLQDILYCRKTFQQGESIYLTFRHLFAQITFQITENLNKSLKYITFTPSFSISQINPDTGEFCLQDSPSALVMPQNKEGEYTFLIPPTTLSIRIHISTTDGTNFETTLENHIFQSGYAYTCPLKLSGDTPGIETVEDFIAFTHLINGESYNNRSLDEFGQTNNGITTYNLLNDLTFTSEESSQVQMIGMYGKTTSSQKETFNHIFDGQGHFLSGLIFNKPVSGNYYTGLFSALSESGIIRNLILDQATYDNPDDADDASFLAGINKGRIENCIIRNCVIQNINKSSSFGNISSCNKGVVVNCQVNNTNIKTEINFGNGITRYNDGGKILNCMVTNCNFSKVKLGGGIICSRTSNGEIQNCYVKGSSGKCNAITLIAENTNIIRCCFYPQSYSKAPVGNNYVSAPSDSIMKYGISQDITENNLYQILNQWISSTGGSTYPGLVFHQWEKGESLPAILIFP